MKRTDWITKCRTLKKMLVKTLKVFDVAIDRHKVLLVSRHVRTTQGNENWSIRSRKIRCNWGKKFFSIILKRQIFKLDRKKYLCQCNYWWAGVRNYVCNTILVIVKIYIFLLLYSTSALLFIIPSHSSSIAWTKTSTATFYHCWSYMEHSDLWIRCVG